MSTTMTEPPGAPAPSGGSPTDRRTPSPRILASIATVAVLLAGSAAVATGLVDRLSIITNPFVVLIVIAAVGLSITSALRQGRRWITLQLPLAALASTMGVMLAALLLHQARVITDAYPATFLIWVSWGVLAIVIAPLGLRRCEPWRIQVQVLAAVIVPLAAFTLINTHYAYWPTVGDLRGAPLKDQASTLPPIPKGDRPARTNRRAKDGDHGTLTPVDIPATRSGFQHRQTYVYLPPAFTSEPRGSLPVLIMLSGTPGESDGWARAGRAIDTADAFAATHDGRAPIMIFPDENGSLTGDTECLDSEAGNADTYLTVDLPAFVHDRLGFDLTPDHTALVGFSEGGTCAASLTLRHPGLSQRFVDLGGALTPSLSPSSLTLDHLFGGDQRAMDAADSYALLMTGSYHDVIAWFDVGTKDPRQAAEQERAVAACREAGITVHASTDPGIHNWEFASSSFARILPELAPTLGLR